MILKILTQLVRVFVGGIFVFSGFVKLVDPIGSQYKFEEYFSEGVLNLEFLIPLALPFSILLIILEITLGVMLLIGHRPRFTIRSLFFLTLIFLFLTWYSAFYDKVTDCGCFGDAITLTAWETFYKNIILIILIFFLQFKVKQITPVFSEKAVKVITLMAVFGFSYITYHVLTHLPIIDFRAYAIGKNIKEGMKYQGDGKIPPVHDFMLENEQEDLAPLILNQEKVLLVLSYDIKNADVNGFPEIRRITEKAISKKYKVYGVSASFFDDIVLIQNQYNLPFNFLFCDETTLKTMMRANPGVMILNKGTIIDKKNWTDVDEIKL